MRYKVLKFIVDQIVTPRLADTVSWRLPDSLIRRVGDSPTHRCGDTGLMPADIGMILPPSEGEKRLSEVKEGKHFACFYLDGGEEWSSIIKPIRNILSFEV